MKVRAGVLMKAPGEFEAAELELDGPRTNELLVRMISTGLCHSDDHVATGDLPVGTYPWCGGHEGAGVVEEVGRGTEGWSKGDHVVFSFVPVCGRCRWCASGKQNLCNLGAHTLRGSRLDDATSFRLSLDGRPVGQSSGLSTFSEYTTVSIASALKVSQDIPLQRLSLLGCGVSTGWGSAVNAAAVEPGQTVIVMGIGGVGICAVQGAAHAGAAHIIAVDPVEFKRVSSLAFGATHAVASIDEGAEIARSLTDGQGADSTIVTVGVTTGRHVGEAVASIRKAGIAVIVGGGPAQISEVPINLLDFTMREKRLTGALFGMASPFLTIPRLIELYTQGSLKVDELATKVYSLDTIAEGFRDMHKGSILRGVIDFAQA